MASYAQGDCSAILNSAHEFLKNGKYQKAVERYELLNIQCPNYVSAKVKEEWNYCKQQLNKTIPTMPSGQHVEVKQKPTSPANPEAIDVLNQYGRVKVSFDAGKMTPTCENLWNVIKQLEDYDTLGLQIEIPWCRDLYSLQLVERRIRNMSEIFIASGIDEARIVSKITMVDVLESFDGLSKDYDRDRIAEHITLINVEDGYNACDSAWLKIVELPKEIPFEIENKDHVPIKDLSDRLARMSISFRNYDDSPQIIDINDCVLTELSILKNNSTFHLLIEVYTHATEEAPATEEYIRDLCVRRANRLRDMYIQMGASPDKIETVCYSNKDPQDSHSPNNRAYVRFVEREESPKQSEEEDLADLRELSEALSDLKFCIFYIDSLGEVAEEGESICITRGTDSMDSIISILNKNKTLKLIVEGYYLAPKAYDRYLALRNAHWIRYMFIERGVSPDQIEYTIKKPQKEQGLQDPHSEECNAANLRIVKMGVQQKKPEEEGLLTEEDLSDIRELTDALSDIKFCFLYIDTLGVDVDSGGYIIMGGYNVSYDKVVEILNKNITLKLIVVYDLDLSDDFENAQYRANRVRDNFIEWGVNSDQIDCSVTFSRYGQGIDEFGSEECYSPTFRIVKREPQNIKILFDYDKDIPKIIDYKAIDEYADFLNNQSTYKLIVEGYTCDQGPEEHNRDLAQRRAIMVRKLFIEKGVDPILIETASYTVNDPQNRQNITNQNECDVAICRIVKR